MKRLTRLFPAFAAALLPCAWAPTAAAHEVLASAALEAPHAIAWTRYAYAWNNGSGSAAVHRVAVGVDPSLEMAAGETYDAEIQAPPHATATGGAAGVAKGATTDFRVNVPKTRPGSVEGVWWPHNRLEVAAGAIRVTIVTPSTDPEDDDEQRRTYLLPYEIEIAHDLWRQ